MLGGYLRGNIAQNLTQASGETATGSTADHSTRDAVSRLLLDRHRRKRRQRYRPRARRRLGRRRRNAYANGQARVRDRGSLMARLAKGLDTRHLRSVGASGRQALAVADHRRQCRCGIRQTPPRVRHGGGRGFYLLAAHRLPASSRLSGGGTSSVLRMAARGLSDCFRRVPHRTRLARPISFGALPMVAGTSTPTDW